MPKNSNTVPTVQDVTMEVAKARPDMPNPGDEDNKTYKEKVAEAVKQHNELNDSKFEGNALTGDDSNAIPTDPERGTGTTQPYDSTEADIVPLAPSTISWSLVYQCVSQLIDTLGFDGLGLTIHEAHHRIHLFNTDDAKNDPSHEEYIKLAHHSTAGTHLAEDETEGVGIIGALVSAALLAKVDDLEEAHIIPPITPEDKSDARS